MILNLVLLFIALTLLSCTIFGVSAVIMWRMVDRYDPRR